MSHKPTSRRTLSIGGATFDLFARTQSALSRIETGSKVPIKDIIESCGGGANNSSVGLSRLGCQAFFAGVLGSDQWGERLVQNFHTEGVELDAATVVEGETTSFSIIISMEAGDRIIFYSPGTNRHLQRSTFNLELASTMDWIFLNHLHENSIVIQDNIIAILGTANGPGFSWNPGGHQIKEGCESPLNRSLLSHTDLLFVNKEEALAFSHQDTIENAHRLFHFRGVNVSCITDGKHGVTAFDGKTLFKCAPDPKGAIVDTTGAGDAFGVGMTWGMLEGKDLPNCLRAGTINATSVIGTIGAQTGLLTDTEMTRRLASLSLPVEELSALL
jgi:sugar/nucleoside kinase (ribokinase family)